MDQQERQVIDDLFGKLQQAEGKTGPRDDEAEALIRERLAEQPAAPYYMAQALVVQQDALASAQSRIQELERQLTQRPEGGSFLSSLFGGGPQQAQPQRRQVAPHAQRYQQQASQRDPWGGGGGSFLGGAMQTALGVAGGVLIADALMGALGGDEAMAGEMAADDMAADDMAADDMATDPGMMEEEPLPGGDDFGGDVGGGDFGDFGDF